MAHKQSISSRSAQARSYASPSTCCSMCAMHDEDQHSDGIDAVMIETAKVWQTLQASSSAPPTPAQAIPEAGPSSSASPPDEAPEVEEEKGLSESCVFW